MQSTRFIKSGRAEGRVAIDLPAGRHLALLVVLKGTTGAGSAFSVSDAGRVSISRAGAAKQAETFEFYHELANLYGGFPERTTSEAGATRVVAMIPFGYLGMPNALDLSTSEEADCELDFASGDFSAFDAAGAQYELYALVSPSQPEQYELIVAEQNVQSNGSGRVAVTLQGVNVAGVAIRDAAGAVDSISLDQDGDRVADNISDDVIRDVTNLSLSVESRQDLGIINGAANGLIAEAQNSVSKLDVVFSKAGTLELTMFRIMPSPKADASFASAANYVDGKLSSGVAV